MRNIFYGILIFLFSALPAIAQNTGGIYPPDVNEGHRSAQYRSAYNLDTDGFAQRLHYQQAIDGDFMWRIIGQTRETDASDFDFDFVQGEFFWQVTPDDTDYRSALRFDIRLSDNNRPHHVGFNWSHQLEFGEGWTARVVGLSLVQFGENDRDGIFLSPRAHLSRKLDNGFALGAEYYGSLGSTENFSLKNNAQTIGPFISKKISKKTSVLAGVQLGLNDVAPDADLRLWVTQGF